MFTNKATAKWEKKPEQPNSRTILRMRMTNSSVTYSILWENMHWPSGHIPVLHLNTALFTSSVKPKRLHYELKVSLVCLFEKGLLGLPWRSCININYIGSSNKYFGLYLSTSTLIKTSPFPQRRRRSPDKRVYHFRNNLSTFKIWNSQPLLKPISLILLLKWRKVWWSFIYKSERGSQ